jgi:hypothetical protein
MTTFGLVHGAFYSPHLRSLRRGGAHPLRITLLSGWTPELKVRTDLATRLNGLGQ